MRRHFRTKHIDFFRSNKVQWNQGFAHLQRAKWHSCMQWGWPSINKGEHLAEWCDYWVLSFKIGTHGISVQVWPHLPQRFKRASI